jgi:hypothetical protein
MKMIEFGRKCAEAFVDYVSRLRALDNCRWAAGRNFHP